jgi:hypothetical protein
MLKGGKHVSGAAGKPQAASARDRQRAPYRSLGGRVGALFRIDAMNSIVRGFFVCPVLKRRLVESPVWKAADQKPRL